MVINVPATKPTATELRTFSVLQAAFFLFVGWGLISRGWPAPAIYAAWGASVLIMVAGTTHPPVIRPVYQVWMALVSPIGWVVSHLLMAAVFYGVVTPVGWWRRNYLGDPLRTRIEKDAPSYWEEHVQRQDMNSYFRQF